MQQSPGKLKIGVFTSSPYDTDVAPECVAAVEETARMLEGLGHEVEYARPDLTAWPWPGATCPCISG
jgi:amidase